MRATCIAAALTAACSFGAPVTVGDGGVDAPPDAPDGGAPVARVTQNLLGLWELDENGGAVLNDTSGLAPVTMTIADLSQVTWGIGVLTLNAPVDILSQAATNIRVVPPVKLSDQVTLEAWVTPANTIQTGTTAGQPARIATLTVQNIGSHLISLGQLGDTWAAQLRTTATGLDVHGGSPMLLNGTVKVGLTHLVVTSTPTERRFYVNGLAVNDDKGGLLDEWKSSYLLVVGGDPNMRNSWAGTLHLLAMYDRALDGSEVMKNFRAGP